MSIVRTKNSGPRPERERLCETSQPTRACLELFRECVQLVVYLAVNGLGHTSSLSLSRFTLLGRAVFKTIPGKSAKWVDLLSLKS